MRGFIFALILMSGSMSAFGQSFKSMTLATNLGDVIASETFCGLTYNQKAIEAFIEKEVPASDMSFTSTLSMMILGGEAKQADMSASAKTAHCTQIRRVAKTYGFIKP